MPNQRKSDKERVECKYLQYHDFLGRGSIVSVVPRINHGCIRKWREDESGKDAFGTFEYRLEPPSPMQETQTNLCCKNVPLRQASLSNPLSDHMFFNFVGQPWINVLCSLRFYDSKPVSSIRRTRRESKKGFVICVSARACE